MTRLAMPALRRLFARKPDPSPAGEVNGPQSAADAKATTKWLDMPYAEVPHGEVMRFATTGSSSKKRIRTLFSKSSTRTISTTVSVAVAELPKRRRKTRLEPPYRLFGQNGAEIVGMRWSIARTQALPVFG